MNKMHTFFAIIYVPVIVLGVVVPTALYRNPVGSEGRKATIQLTVFLLLTWYSPVLQSAATMYSCYEDKDLGWVLVEDTSVSCEWSDWTRLTVVVHVVALVIFVGLGFPVLITMKTLELKKKNLLNAATPFIALFQWYTPTVPWFEAVQLVRKVMLIVVTTVISNTNLQAFASAGVNIVFLALVLSLKPWVVYSSSLFGGRNLNTMVEVVATSTTILGNALAVVGSYENSTTNTIGIVFALLNLSFALVFVIVYTFDVLRLQAEVQQTHGQTRRKSVMELMGTDVVDFLNEWYLQVIMIEKEGKNSKKRLIMIRELAFLRTKVTEAVKKRVKVFEGEGADETTREALLQFDAMLKTIASDCERYKPEGYADNADFVNESIHTVITKVNATAKLLHALKVKLTLFGHN